MLLQLLLVVVRLLLEDLVRPLARAPRQLDPDAAVAVPLYSLEGLKKGVGGQIGKAFWFAVDASVALNTQLYVTISQ